MAVGIGSRGYKDFGLSTNMTLPITSTIEPDPKVLVENAFMPEERKERRKKQARFALEDPPEQETGVKVQRKQSWFKRLFRRSKKRDRLAPYLLQPEEDVRIVRSESDPELSASKSPPGQVGGNGDQGGAKPKRRKAKTTNSSRQTKALSIAFTPVPSTAGQASSAVEVVFKPSSSTSSTRKVVLQYRKESADGLGLHLSGCLPPVTVTHVKQGGQAKVAGIGEGDIILEVNGIDCRKKVETSQLVALKLLGQQTPPARNVAAEQDSDEDKMIGREEELEADHSTVKITSIDSSGSEEDTASPRVVEAEVKIVRKGKKRRVSSTRASGGDFGEPLAASSPITKEQGAGNGDRPKRKKKSSNHSLTNREDGLISGTTEDSSKVSKSSLAKSSAVSGASEGDKTSTDKKKKKRKTSRNGADVSPRTPSKKSASKTSISSDVTSPEVKTVQVVRSNDNSVPPQQSISVDEVDGSYEMERSARSRRSSSPKSRYRMGEHGEPAAAKEKAGKKKSKAEQEEPAAAKEKAGKKKSKDEQEEPAAAKEKAGKKKPKAKASEKGGEPEKVTVGVITKEKNGKKKSKATDGEKKKKRKKKSTAEESSPCKRSKEESQPSSRKVSATAKEHPPTEPTEYSMEEPLSLSVDAPPQSSAISGSIESNTLTFVYSKKGSKSSLNELGKEEAQSKRETNTLPRRKSTDQSRSSSECEFRSELREASMSQHDMPEAINSSMTIEIDPNIKVKKSGLVKGKTPVRPSIFDQSSSPEPEEVVPISSGPVEDNLLDSEFKVKKSGVVQGRKTSSTSRPSILDENESKTSPNDIQRGEMKYNKKVIEGMDLSAVPETAPTLGLVAGRDRLDTANRSLVKRRPASQKQSLLLDSKADKIMGTERVDLSQMTDKKPVGSVGAAKQLFENSSQQDAKYSARFSKLEKKPISATQQANKPPEMGDKKVPAWARSQTAKEGEKENAGKPSWIVLAEQKRSSFIEGKETTTTPSRVPAPSSNPNSQKSPVPQLGHVAQRLAMFQKS